jgi:hypothetical protein
VSTLAVGRWVSGKGVLLQLQNHADGTSVWYLSTHKVPQSFGVKTVNIIKTMAEEVNSGILTFCGHNFDMRPSEKQNLV